MTRIAPSLATGIDDLSQAELASFRVPTSRQHIRVPFAARGIRFGTINLPRPHNRLINTWGYGTGYLFNPQSPFPPPLPPSQEIAETFESQEQWTRTPASGTCPNSGTVDRAFSPATADVPTYPWRGSVLQYSGAGLSALPSHWSDPPDAYHLRHNCAFDLRYDPLPGEVLYDPEPATKIPIIRDDVIGVATVGQLNGLQLFGSLSSPNTTYQQKWSTLVHVLSSFGASYGTLGQPIAYSGRYWVSTTQDFYGSLKNTLETRAYQVVTDFNGPSGVDIQGYGVRQRWAWVDSRGGVKDLRIMGRTKVIRTSMLYVQTWRREWIDDGVGGAVPIPDGQPAVLHRSAFNNLSFTDVEWSTGEYPGHPTIDLPAFEAAYDAGDEATVSAIVANNAWGGGRLVATHAQYKWHRFRYEPSPPTFGPATSRLMGHSERYGPNVGNLGIPCNLFYNPRLFTSSAQDDHEITYPWSTPAVDERTAETPAVFEGAIPTLGISSVPYSFSQDSLKDTTYHPLTAVPTINKTDKIDRYRKRITTQTSAGAIDASAFNKPPLWRFSQFDLLNNEGGYIYRRISPRLRLSRVYGPFGQADAVMNQVAWGQVPGVYGGIGVAYWNLMTQKPVPVEGWNPNKKPTITPSPIVIDVVAQDGVWSYAQQTLVLSSPTLGTSVLNPGPTQRRLFVSSRVTPSPGLSARNISVDLNYNSNLPGWYVGVYVAYTGTYGTYSFTIRAFDGYDYSEAIPVTVNVTPPIP